jgi:hypothetical protein
VLAIIGIVFGVFSIWGIILVVPLAALMLYGAKQERGGFMIPYLVYMVTVSKRNSDEDENAINYLL